MTSTLRIIGWKAGLRKVSMTQCLRERTSLSLSEAKRVVDRVLEGHEVDIVLPPDGDIRQLAHQLRLIGARVTLVSALGDVNSTLLDQQYIDWFEQQLRGALQQPIQPNRRLNAFQQLISQFVETLPSIPKEEYGHFLALLDRWQRDGYIDGVNFHQDETALVWLSDLIGTIDGILEAAK